MITTAAKKRALKKYQGTAKGRKTMAKAMVKWRHKIRVDILTHYGNGKLACVKCGENNIFCLSLDHINGGGTKHRREIGGAVKLYPLLRRQGYPDGYQTLCMNCQWKKRGSPVRRDTVYSYEVL